jgi:RNA polymerase sigma-70 factor (ECF subfamily)
LLSDDELASRCLKGDDQAWEVLLGRYHRGIWNVAYHFTGRVAEADDLTQEIFLHVLGALKHFDPHGSMGAWLRRVARNYAIDQYRRRRRERALTSGVEAPEVKAPVQRSDPHAALEQKDLAAWIRSALDRLPDELRQAVMLRDLQEMSYEEMSDLLDLPLGTVKSRINRGRLELARHLKRRRGEWSHQLESRGEA